MHNMDYTQFDVEINASMQIVCHCLQVWSHSEVIRPRWLTQCGSLSSSLMWDQRVTKCIMALSKLMK